MTTLNIGAGMDDFWGDIKLDIKAYQPNIIIFDLNSNKPLPFLDNTFDEVRLHRVLSFLSNPQFIFEEIYRVLKPNGKFNLLDSNIRSLRYWKMHRTIGKYGVAWYDKMLSFYDANALSNRFKLLKFRFVRIRKLSNIKPFKDMLELDAIK